jgi:hypothetical protein
VIHGLVDSQFCSNTYYPRFIMRTSLIALALIAGLLIAAAAPSPAWARNRGGYGHGYYGGYGHSYYGGYGHGYYGGYGGYYGNLDYGFGPTIPNYYGRGYGYGYYGGYGRGYYGGYRGNSRNDLPADYGFGPSNPR